MKNKSNNRELKSNETLKGNNIVVIWPSLKSKNQMAGKLDTQGLELPKGWSPGMVCSLCCCPLALYINGCPGEERDDVFSVNEQEWFTNSLKESVRRTLVNEAEEYSMNKTKGGGDPCACNSDSDCKDAVSSGCNGNKCRDSKCVADGGMTTSDNELENIGIKGRSNKGGTSDRDERELVRMREREGIHGERVGSADEMSRNGRLREKAVAGGPSDDCCKNQVHCHHGCGSDCKCKSSGDMKSGGIKTYGQSSKVKIRPQAEPQINESVRRKLNEYFYTQAEGDGVCAGAGYGPMTGWSCEDAGDGTEDCTVECSSIVPGGPGGTIETNSALSMDQLHTGGGETVQGNPSNGKEDVMVKKNRMRSASNAVGELKEYTRNRTNIERFLNEDKEDKPKGKRKGSTPRPSDKAMMNMTKKVLGGVTPSTGMNNWWCCLVACNNPGCKGDRWEVVMNPWG